MKFEIKVILISLVIVVLSGGLMVAYFAYRNTQSKRAIIMPTDTNKGWFFFQDDYHRTTGTIRVEEGALRIDCDKALGTPESLAIMQRRFVADAGHRYHVVFSAKASARRNIVVTADNGMYANSSANIGLTETVPLDENWSKHDLSFTATGKLGHPVALPIFNLGATTGTVWIKDVMVEEVQQ
jgi:hypothetical protein